MPKVKREDDTSDKENKPSDVDKLPSINHQESKESNKASDDKKTSPVKKVRRSPNTKKFVKRLPNGDRVRKMVPEVPLPRNIAAEDGNNNVAVCSDCMKESLTPEGAILRITGGVELVPLLARRRRVGARTLPSCDVTRPPEDTCRYVLILIVSMEQKFYRILAQSFATLIAC